MLLGLGVSSECVQRATATGGTNFAVLLRLSQDGYGCVIRAVSAQERNWEDTTCKSAVKLVANGQALECFSVVKKPRNPERKQLLSSHSQN